MTNNKRRIIILEGLDKTGKTTFSEELLKDIPGTIMIKQNRRKLKNVKEAYLQMCLVLTKLPGSAPVILDRFYPSQMVYSILRGTDELDDVFYTVLEKDMLEHPSLTFEIIYCTASEETITERFISNKEEHVNIEQIKMLKERYDTFISKTKLPVKVHDTTW